MIHSIEAQNPRFMVDRADKYEKLKSTSGMTILKMEHHFKKS